MTKTAPQTRIKPELNTPLKDSEEKSSPSAGVHRESAFAASGSHGKDEHGLRVAWPRHCAQVTTGSPVTAIEYKRKTWFAPYSMRLHPARERRIKVVQRSARLSSFDTKGREFFSGKIKSSILR